MKHLQEFIVESIICEKRKSPILFDGDIYNIDDVCQFLENNYKVRLKQRTGKKDLAEALEELQSMNLDVISIYNDRMNVSGFKDGMGDRLIDKKYSICIQTADQKYYHWNNKDKKWSLYEYDF